MRAGKYITIDWPVLIGCLLVNMGFWLEFHLPGACMGLGLTLLLSELLRRLKDVR